MKKIFKKYNVFLITPIGAPDSLDRNRVNQWMRIIYGPVLKEKYNIIRADLIAVPGTITKQVIDYICDADLAIIDFTPSEESQVPNPNVMYEAAIRHIAKKPTIQIAPQTLRLPFDIKDFRCIFYDSQNLNYPSQLKKELKKSIDEVSAPDYKSPDIIGHTYDLERIVSDPEKFIMLLKKHLIPDGSGTLRLGDYGPSGYYSGATGASMNLKGDTGAWSSGNLGNITAPSFAPFARCPMCGGSGSPVYHTYGSINYVAAERQQYVCSSCNSVFFV